MLLPMVSCFYSSGNANNHSSFQTWNDALLAAAILKMHFKMAAASSAFHVWNDEWLLALPDEWKHETIGSNMAVLF